VVLLLGLAWGFGALWFDFPLAGFRHWLAWLLVVAALTALAFVRPRWPVKLEILGVLSLIALWWLTLQPKEDRNWQPDVARTAWAEIHGNDVTLHNVRNFGYRTETDYIQRWETRTVDMSQLAGLDLAITFWGSPWMAHPIASFRFDDAPPVCFSIEVRKVVGQEFSTLASLYRQAQLIYIVADERDVIRLRSNYRHGEDVYLYHTVATPEQARERFLEYLAVLNSLRARPRWYNVITTNCTTSIREQRPVGERMPWDWRILLNGKADEMLYEHRLIATDNLPFGELKDLSLINVRARAADKDPEFWRRIRQGTPGFLEGSY